MSNETKDWLKPRWQQEREKAQKQIREEESKFGTFNDRVRKAHESNIDMGGGSSDSESESKWSGTDSGWGFDH